MLERLQERWGVGPIRIILILIVFAIGGSCSGYLAKVVMGYLDIGMVWYSIPLYILIVTMLWPCCVIITSIPFGQFRFFKSYLQRMFRRISGPK